MSQLLDDRLAALFEQALELPPSRREAFLTGVCPDDAPLKAELTTLLEAYEGADVYFTDLVEHVVEHVVAPALSEMYDSDSLQRLREALASTYRIERELEGGGMGRVYVAADLRLKRQVVIKVPPPEAISPAGVERFRREIEVAAQLQHPHIVPLLSADALGGTWYYTMPFVVGDSLRDRLAREGSLPLDTALHIWRDVLDALAHAHAHGVVHRDIKPANILLSGRNALVTDFGIARAIETATESSDTAGTAPGPTFGTPSYMAPEQARGGDAADPRVDIYQAGLVMYEMLSGRLPFEGATTGERLEARLTEEPKPLSASEAPPPVAQVVMRCLARVPEERPSGAEALLAELEVLAPAPRRRSLRGPIAVGTVAAAAAVLVFAWTGERSPTAVSRYTPDLAAYEWYRRGMDVALLRGVAGQREAVGYFERAVEIDSMYAAAWAGIARLSVQIWNAATQDERPTWLERALSSSIKAVALDDSDPDAHASLGQVRLVTGDYARAERSLARALELDPQVSRGHEHLARVYMMTGRPRTQLVEAQRGVAADPFSHSAIRELALALAMNGRCEEGLGRLDELKRLTPPAQVAGVVAGMCHASRRRWDAAIAEFRWSADLGAAFAPAFLAHSLARAGRRDEAELMVSELLAGARESHGAFGITTVYAGMGDYDQAFAWLDRAVDEGSVNSYIMHPVFADLHRDPRFRPIERRLGVSFAAP